MADTPNCELVLDEPQPRGYRMTRWLDHRGWLPWFQEWIVDRFPQRDSYDWEWYLSKPSFPHSIEGTMAGPRFPVCLSFQMPEVNVPDLGGITVRVFGSDGWKKISCDPRYKEPGQGDSLEIRLLQLTLAKRINVQFEKDIKFSFRLKIVIGEYGYLDLFHAASAHHELEDNQVPKAVEHLEAALRMVPDHFFVADMMSRACRAKKDWHAAKLWAMRSVEYSSGEWGKEPLTAACVKDELDLIAEAETYRDEAKEWDVGGHMGSVCLKKDDVHWIGFGCHHLSQYRQIIDVRRQAAARMLREVHFTYFPDHQAVVIARVRVLRADGTIVNVPDDQLVYMDDPEHNPAIKTESRKRAQFYLPEMNRGDCIYFEYTIVHWNGRRPDDKPDLFILTDMNGECPTWRSDVRVISPRGWDIRCIGINDAPDPSVIEDGDWKTFHATAQRLHYDDWSAVDFERRYRSPHICTSWNDRTWTDIANHALDKHCHAIREDELPAHLADAIVPGTSELEKLRLGFDWIRDRLKYMSLPIAKERTSDPDLARKIVEAGVGDCMDKAYLVLLLCQKLGLKAEYILTSSEHGHVVETLPARQFDHILVRTMTNGEWMYLDATSTDTPFGWTPIFLQGIPVLSLGDSRTLDVVAEQSPDQNTVEIDESLECHADGSVEGEFAMRTYGIPARWWDDQWKSASLSVNDPERVANAAIRRQLLSVSLRGWELHPMQAGDPRFEFTGRHTRRRLVEIGGRQVGTVTWDTPMFPLHWAKNRDWQGLAVFPLPMIYRIKVKLSCPEGWTIEGPSSSPQIETVFGSVKTSQESNGHFLSIDRKLEIGKRFIRGEPTERIPEFLMAWEDALRLAYLIRKAD